MAPPQGMLNEDVMSAALISVEVVPGEADPNKKVKFKCLSCGWTVKSAIHKKASVYQRVRKHMLGPAAEPKTSAKECVRPNPALLKLRAAFAIYLNMHQVKVEAEVAAGAMTASDKLSRGTKEGLWEVAKENQANLSAQELGSIVGSQQLNAQQIFNAVMDNPGSSQRQMTLAAMEGVIKHGQRNTRDCQKEMVEIMHLLGIKLGTLKHKEAWQRLSEVMSSKAFRLPSHYLATDVLTDELYQDVKHSLQVTVTGTGERRGVTLVTDGWKNPARTKCLQVCFVAEGKNLCWDSIDLSALQVESGEWITTSNTYANLLSKVSCTRLPTSTPPRPAEPRQRRPGPARPAAARPGPASGSRGNLQHHLHHLKHQHLHHLQHHHHHHWQRRR